MPARQGYLNIATIAAVLVASALATPTDDWPGTVRGETERRLSMAAAYVVPC